ncbi:MAG: hypothetical protein RDU01_10680, partial [Thermodesulfovibrionales bacterium]|nr:hypothetical protein [Thermodesulfovibrionales bacterium]
MDIAQRKREFEYLQKKLTFSQLYAKTSFPDIYSIPSQANKAGGVHGVTFQFNDTAIKIGREFNTRRNTRFMGRGDKMECKITMSVNQST